MSREPIRALLPVLATAHVVVAALCWLSATSGGVRRPYTAAMVLALAVTIVALGAVVGALAYHRDARGVTTFLVAGALLAQLGLVASMREARFCYEEGYPSGLSRSSDGAWRVSMRVCEPYRSHHFARLDLTRVKDRRAFTLPIRVRRGPRDVITHRTDWIGMRPLDENRYWLTLSTAVSRRGPQFFELQVDVEPPVLREIRRGLHVTDGRAEWDCEVWGAGAAREDRADAVGAICSEARLSPPEGVCLLRGLAAACDERLVRAALCRPDLARHPEFRDCLTRLATGIGHGPAWDALVAIGIEVDDPSRAREVVAAAHDSETSRGVPCAASRDAARRLAEARRHPSTSRQRLALSDLLANRTADASQRCGPLSTPFAAELAVPAARLEWEIAAIDRQWGFVGRSCDRTAALVAAPGELGLSRLEGPVRAEALAWAAACRERAVRTGGT